jgi:hypothetical protein
VSTANSSPPSRAGTVVVAEQGLDAAAHLDQHGVAGLAATAVVDLGEAVQVDHQQAALPAGAAAVGQQVTHQRPTVGEAGELIGV